MKKLILFAGCLLLTLPAFAQDDSSTDFEKWQVRLRALSIIPDESAKIGIIGGDVDISTAIIPELDITYFFTKNIAAELVLGTAKHDVKTLGSNLSAIELPASFDVDLGSVWLLPPTLMLQYHYPMGDFKPYAGAGVNYTIFYSEKSGDVVKDIEYDDSFGFAVQLGFDYNITEKYFINLDIKKLFLSTDVTVDASNLAPGLSIPAEVDIDPWLIGLGVGIRF